MDYEFDLAGGTSEFYIDADYYDHEFKSRTADVQWYTQHYLETEGPALELAVGTGRVALRAVRKGAEIYGIDLSPTMLARARTRRDALPKSKRSKLHLIEGDMRTFSLDRKFELITCPFNAFQHLYTREDIEACLRCVREHLAPGGLFLFDVLLPDVEYLSRSPYKRFPGVSSVTPPMAPPTPIVNRRPITPSPRSTRCGSTTTASARGPDPRPSAFSSLTGVSFPRSCKPCWPITASRCSPSKEISRTADCAPTANPWW